MSTQSECVSLILDFGKLPLHAQMSDGSVCNAFIYHSVWFYSVNNLLNASCAIFKYKHASVILLMRLIQLCHIDLIILLIWCERGAKEYTLKHYFHPDTTLRNHSGNNWYQACARFSFFFTSNNGPTTARQREISDVKPHEVMKTITNVFVNRLPAGKKN